MPSATLSNALEVELAHGIAQALADWDIVTYTGPDATVPADAVRPLYFGPDEPANTPDERVLLTVRPAVKIRGQIVGVPVALLWRGEPGTIAQDGLNFTGLLFRRLDRLSHYTFGTVRVGAVLYQSAGTLGPDTKRRASASANYLFRGILASVND